MDHGTFGHGRTVTTVLIGMALCVGIALLVLAAVAMPRLRRGEKLLTSDGEDAVRDMSRRARSRAASARARAAAVAGKGGDRTADGAEPADSAAAGGDLSAKTAKVNPEQVIDLRDGSGPKERAPEPASAARARRALDAELGWGEPQPGPRHGR